MQYRLRRGDMIQVYKIVKGLDRVPSEMFFKFCDTSDDMRQTRGHNWKIFKPQHTLDVRKHTFSVRIINDSNSLSAEVVNAESLNIFKNKLDKLWVLDMYRNPTMSNIGVSLISLHHTPRPHTLNRVIRNLMRLAHI